MVHILSCASSVGIHGRSRHGSRREDSFVFSAKVMLARRGMSNWGVHHLEKVHMRVSHRLGSSLDELSSFWKLSLPQMAYT